MLKNVIDRLKQRREKIDKALKVLGELEWEDYDVHDELPKAIKQPVTRSVRVPRKKRYSRHYIPRKKRKITCVAPGCGRVFLGRKHRHYCSKRCTEIAYTLAGKRGAKAKENMEQKLNTPKEARSPIYGDRKCVGCGITYKPKSPNQTHHSNKCYHRWWWKESKKAAALEQQKDKPVVLIPGDPIRANH